jgi:hypothetical protein
MRHPAMPAPGRRCLECVQKAKSEVKRVLREKRLDEHDALDRDLRHLRITPR